jgi:predicted HicB family RNase H-like nuclease
MTTEPRGKHSSDDGAGPAKQQFNVYLPPALIRRAKYRALDEQTSLSDLVERALISYLEHGA